MPQLPVANAFGTLFDAIADRQLHCCSQSHRLTVRLPLATMAWAAGPPWGRKGDEEKAQKGGARGSAAAPPSGYHCGDW